MDLITTNRSIRSELQEKKYAFISGDEFTISPQLKAANESFWTDWDNLEPDDYLKNNARFRTRRLGYFYWTPEKKEALPMPEASYFQSSKINSYAGDIPRKFAPLSDSTLTNIFLHALIQFDFRQLPVESEKLRQPWEINVHQIRIAATPDEAGQPAPEGIHHDGEDFGCIHLVNRRNASGGVNTIYDNDRNPLESSTLRQPMDTILVWDPCVMHGVTSIRPENPDDPAIRDTLLIGYTCRPDLKKPI